MELIGQLAAGVAHEVRNPLNAILSITEALFREPVIEGKGEFEPFIKHIRTQVKRLAQLMNDLLELGKSIPASSIVPIHLFSHCQETISVWNSSGSARKIPVVLVADSDPSDIYVAADSLKLQQVIFNLLENAAQSSSNDSKIKISISFPDTDNTAKPIAVIRIIDAGKGIPETCLGQIFDPFYTGRKEGTGLGLTLAKHIIENMGGTVQLCNNIPPPGCTAEVRIPQARKEQT
jgi:two-component system NtrC family sensor kinase